MNESVHQPSSAVACLLETVPRVPNAPAFSLPPLDTAGTCRSLSELGRPGRPSVLSETRFRGTLTCTAVRRFPPCVRLGSRGMLWGRQVRAFPFLFSKERKVGLPVPRVIRKRDEQTCNTPSYKRPGRTRPGAPSRVRVPQRDTAGTGGSVRAAAALQPTLQLTARGATEASRALRTSLSVLDFKMRLEWFCVLSLR